MRDVYMEDGVATTKYQIGGDHYKKKGIQPIQYIQANELGFEEGSIVKYITRYKDKGGIEDLRKCRQYLEFIAEYKYNEKL